MAINILLFFIKNIKMSSTDEAKKKTMRKDYIYKALEAGWTVKKDPNTPKTFEFTRGNLDKMPIDDSKHHHHSKRSISAPIVKNNSHFKK